MRYELTEEEWKLIVEHRKNYNRVSQEDCKHNWVIFTNIVSPVPNTLRKQCMLCNKMESLATAGFYG